MLPIGMKSSTPKKRTWKNKNEKHTPKQQSPSALEQCAVTFFELCRSYGFNGPKNLQSTVEKWKYLSEEKGWIAFEKYKTAAFFSFHNDQEIPEKAYYSERGDNPAVFAGGNLYPFVRDLLTTKDRMSFLTSVLYLKKGFPRPDAAALREAELETFHDLTDTKHTEQHEKDRSFKVQALNWGDTNKDSNVNINITYYTIQEELRRTVKEVFHNSKYSSYDRSKAFMPSTSANYINSRAQAGAVGAIIGDESLLKGLRTPQKEEIKRTKVVINPDEDSIASDRLSEYILNTTDQDQKFEKLWVRLLGRALQEDPDAIPLGLAEPLKKRVITKGPPFLYTVMKPLQKFMWKVMKDHPTFKLTGEPVNEMNLWQQLGRNLEDNEYYLSIDYANATNKLKSWVTETLADAVADELSLYSAERRLLKKSLIHHNIITAETKRLDQELKGLLRKGKITKDTVDYISRRRVIEYHKIGKPQTNGQLMGSIMSFPFLCLANAAICRMSYEYEKQRKIGLINCPLLINGDDGLMKATHFIDRVHTTVSQFIGLEPSIGKVYRSRKFFNINSTTFTRTLHSSPIGEKIAIIPFKMVKYVNFGLIKGLKRSAIGNGKHGLEDESSKYSNVSARAHELERFTPPNLYKKVFKQFVEHNLKGFHSIPWFLPRWIGGLGIPLTFGTPSNIDLRLATRVLLNWKNEQPVDLTAPSGWQIRQLAQKRAPAPFVTTDPILGTSLKDQYESLLGRLGISLLFDSNVSLDDLLKQDDREVTMSKIRHNEKLWRMTKGALCRPISMERLEFQRRYEGLSVSLVSSSAQNELKRQGILKIDLDPLYNDVSIVEAEWDTLV